VDAASFTWVRLASGALLLASAARFAPGLREKGGSPGGRVFPAAALALYAVAFSFAYLRLPVGTGALVLFGLTQVTMLAWGFRRGERPAPRAWLGIAAALAGLVTLTAPGAEAPDFVGVALMSLAGIAWGAYSLFGRRARDPIAANARAFLLATLFTGPLVLFPAAPRVVSPRGLLLAAVSGALASGLGYSLWYRALPHFSRTQAAAMQLTVPVLTAFLGLAFLAEVPSTRVVLGGALILSGVALAVTTGPSPRSEGAAQALGPEP
jgi:drug/metabolite transporter (DMT)-like permease